jgi:parallel beta-helix repeat protein
MKIKEEKMFNHKRFLIAVTVLFTAAGMISGSAVRAEVTFVSGDVSGVWDADSVIVTDSVRVPAGESLTIMPGVTILVTSYYKFEVLDGAVLHAVGTETDSIRLLPFTQGDKTLGIDFINASDESIMEFWYISDAITTGIHLENSDITIRNCLIENNEAGTGSDGGGAIEVLNGSDALIENNVINDNYSADYGGGIFVGDSSPDITGNTITDNLAGYYGSAAGGGIAVFGNSDPQITFNEITFNSVNPTGIFTVNNGTGGGIYYGGESNGLISSNYIYGNIVDTEPQTRTYGGGLGIRSASPLLENNVIADNQAQGNDGGGIYMYSSHSTLINNTIVNNQAGDLGGAIYAELSDPTIVNSILYFNQDSAGTEIFLADFASVAVYYSDVEGSWPGEGNVDVDPLFRDMLAGDYHLQATMCGDQDDSPLIDAGSPEYSDSLVACEWGLGTDLSDMGAYGGAAPANPTGIDDDSIVSSPSEFFTVSSYPNPFNARTTISYQLPEASHVSLDIYDNLGRKIKNLVDNRFYSAGEHQVTWNASENSSGIYFYRLEVDGRSETHKMLLIK